MKERPSPDFVRRVLRYDEDTGLLYWRTRSPDSFRSGKAKEAMRWNSRYADKQAFTATKGDGYRCGAINKVGLQAHVVAWCVHHGSWPTKEIDHINGNRQDNRICNLREVDRYENAKNTKTPKNNTSGFIGVSYCKRDKIWIAHACSRTIS